MGSNGESAVAGDELHATSNLPGWRWARIKQLVLVGLSSSWHSEACNALGSLLGCPTAKFVSATTSVRAAVNLYGLDLWNAEREVHVAFIGNAENEKDFARHNNQISFIRVFVCL